MQFRKSIFILLSTFFTIAILTSACGGEGSTDQETSTSEVKNTPAENSQVLATSNPETKNVEEKSNTITKEEIAEDTEKAKSEDTPKGAEEKPKVEKVAPKKEKKKIPKKRAKMQFDEKLYDYGFVMQGDTVTHDFHFKNIGNDNLVITKVKPSCGCTVPIYPKEPIAPGEDGKISVVFKTAGKLGRQIPSIDVYTNYKRKIKLELKGFVDAERAKPPQVKIEEEETEQ